MVGYETAAGRGRVMSGIRKRIGKFKAKAGRIKKLRSAGIKVKTIAGATGMPAMAYGLDALGASMQPSSPAKKSPARKPPAKAKTGAKRTPRKKTTSRKS